MLDWLVSIQRPNGAFQGGTVGAVHKQAGQAVDTGDVLVELS